MESILYVALSLYALGNMDGKPITGFITDEREATFPISSRTLKQDGMLIWAWPPQMSPSFLQSHLNN